MSKSDPVARIRADAFEKAAPELAEHGDWLRWLKREFGWTEMTALNFIRIAEHPQSKNFLDLNVPISALYLLFRPSTPPEAVEAVEARAATGEKLSVADVKAEIATFRIVDEPPTVAPAVRVEWVETIHEIVAPVPKIAEAKTASEEGNVVNVLFGQVATPANQDIEPGLKRIAASAAKRSWLDGHQRAVACMEIQELQVDLHGEDARKEARRLTADGAQTPLQAIFKLLPLLTEAEWDKLATVVRERAAGNRS